MFNCSAVFNGALPRNWSHQAMFNCSAVFNSALPRNWSHQAMFMSQLGTHIAVFL
jgi:truncated hemoglobin YjbI